MGEKRGAQLKHRWEQVQRRARRRRRWWSQRMGLLVQQQQGQRQWPPPWWQRARRVKIAAPEELRREEAGDGWRLLLCATKGWEGQRTRRRARMRRGHKPRRSRSGAGQTNRKRGHSGRASGAMGHRRREQGVVRARSFFVRHTPVSLAHDALRERAGRRRKAQRKERRGRLRQPDLPLTAAQRPRKNKTDTGREGQAPTNGHHGICMVGADEKPNLCHCSLTI
jgi:hypothetical protein